MSGPPDRFQRSQRGVPIEEDDTLGHHGVLDAIGSTPLVELRRVVPAGSARVVAKLEWANPTGSMKDRMAVAAIRAAAADGRLPPSGTVVEYTAGTTGISLALVCAALGYRLEVVFSDAFSEEKRRTMTALGAHITDVPSEEGRINERLMAAEEGIFAGASSGANVVAALRLAERLGPGATVATVIVDSGLRYVSTDLYRPAS